MIKSIQIDAYEVQLGAGVLLQFQADGGCVRVLADAGLPAGYKDDHVQEKLADSFASFSGADRYLDLIIGTHYDKDHLQGLVKVIEDETIRIGEAWMPPVANDSRPSALTDLPTEADLLSTQFAAENGEATLRSYLSVKAKICAKLVETEQLTLGGQPLPANDRMEFKPAFAEPPSFDREDFLTVADILFDAHLRHTHMVGGGDCSQCAGDINLPEDIDALEISIHEPLVRNGLFRRRFIPTKEFLLERWHDDPEVAAINRLSLADLRRSAARDAINAASLYRVVKALKARGIPIRSYSIADGSPQRFVWQADVRRFIPRSRGETASLEVQLLGPSKSLIKKHWHRLPIGDYTALALFRSVPVKSITPSNQLSYVLRFDCRDQKLLIAGDAGCVDFKPARAKDFYPDLLAELGQLHFIQVAHHGGLNAHFYNVLLESDYPEQTERSFLLLSHATHDATRPSEIFDMFVAQARSPGDDFSILFTSEPDADKVANYKALIYPRVSPKADRGDVRLEFDGAWEVTKHAIEV